jgi:hypothetical protein
MGRSSFRVCRSASRTFFIWSGEAFIAVSADADNSTTSNLASTLIALQIRVDAPGPAWSAHTLQIPAPIEYYVTLTTVSVPVRYCARAHGRKGRDGNGLGREAAGARGRMLQSGKKPAEICQRRLNSDPLCFDFVGVNLTHQDRSSIVFGACRSGLG